MQRRTAQAAGQSVALHALLLFGLLLIRLHASDGPSHLAIINAELLSDSGASFSATEVVGPGAGRTEAPPESTAPEPPPSADEGTERAADSATADTAKPAHADDDAAESAAPVSLTAADREPNETETPPPAASAASGIDTPAPGSSPADSAAQPGTAAGAAVASAEPNAAEDVAVAAAESNAAQDAAVAQNATEPASPARPVEKREREMLATRFASFTGKIAPQSTKPAVAWKQDGRAYTAVFRQLPSTDPMGLERLAVDVSTEQGGRRMSTQLTMTRLAFSNFAQFIDHWDPDVQIHDDEIDGRFHSNTEIKLLSGAGASPVFHGKVTIAAHEINTQADAFGGFFSKRRVFPEGLEMGVRRIQLPAGFMPFLNEAAHGTEAVQRFERSARIRFYPDGTYGWTYLNAGGASDGEEQRRAITNPAHYLIGLDGATLRVSGIVKGKVLVYTAERIVIDDDLRYLDGRETGDGGDYLGLVAEKNVDIAEPDITGPGDLEVHASIYARQQFAVREFRSRPSGTLLIYGSVTAGSITATEPRYATKIEFDRRLENARPPSFPLTDRYELESWNGEWRVEEPAASD